LCDDDTIRVVYQGDIAPARYVRARIPVPPATLPGKVTIMATLCYPTGVDPHHPGNYTRAGLEPTFRPHDQKRKDPKKLHADSKTFFGKTQSGLMEDELRRDAWKWENCLHTSVTFMGKTLRNPVLDIHYNARADGRDFAPTEKLPYALVISVHAKNLGDLYDQIIRKYAGRLEALRPVVEILPWKNGLTAPRVITSRSREQPQLISKYINVINDRNRRRSSRGSPGHRFPFFVRSGRENGAGQSAMVGRQSRSK